MAHQTSVWLLTVQALGIIYGDIGTSPLYVLNTVFSSPPNSGSVIGVISLIIYSLFLFVGIKYAIFFLYADNAGEGGVFALSGLLSGPRSSLGKGGKTISTVLALAGAAMLFGDGAFTPPVSVLGAISGLTIAAPSLSNAVTPIAIAILVLLFVAQRFGTGKIGLAFGPIMLLWFFTISAIGLWRLTQAPSVLRAFNPYEAFHYLAVRKERGFFSLAGVFLCMTGLEALYADLGHVCFARYCPISSLMLLQLGAPAIRLSWFCVVFPALVCNYLGQGALLINNPALFATSFYSSSPSWLYWPLLVLATFAAIIASQAMITGSFSLAHQAISLRYAPPLEVVHTSKTVIGQIYVPFMNWTLLILCIALTAGFGSSASITNAYGVTVRAVSTCQPNPHSVSVCLLFLSSLSASLPRVLIRPFLLTD
jgi:KUP system potassium uptake protein